MARLYITGKIPCAQASGRPMGQCDFGGVACAGGGSVVGSVTLPDGRKPMPMVRGGKATSADPRQADSDMTFKAAEDGNATRSPRP